MQVMLVSHAVIYTIENSGHIEIYKHLRENSGIRRHSVPLEECLGQHERTMERHIGQKYKFRLHSTTRSCTSTSEPNKFILGGPGENQPEHDTIKLQNLYYKSLRNSQG